MESKQVQRQHPEFYEFYEFYELQDRFCWEGESNLYAVQRVTVLTMNNSKLPT
jgi:hypothetical protein